MVRIQVDILAHGVKADKRPICEIDIADIGEGCDGNHNYQCDIHDGKTGGGTVYVEHRREDGIYVLIQKCLERYNGCKHNNTMC